MIIFLTGSAISLYIFFLRDLVLLLLDNSAPAWFESLIRQLYPRFLVERERLEASFFLQKADQVMLRGSLVTACTAAFLAITHSSEKIRHRIKNWINTPVSFAHVRILRVIFYSMLIWLNRETYADLTRLLQLKEFYSPVLLLKIFPTGFPSHEVIIFLTALLFISAALVIANVRAVLFSVLSVLLFIYIQALLFSFEKMTHGFATFTYCAMLFPFLLYEYKEAKFKKSEVVKGWPLQLILLVISLVYLMSGLEKLLVSGLAWISPETLRTYLYLHKAPLGLWIAEKPVLSGFIMTFALLFQLCFISILFFKKLKWPLLICGVLFHVGTVLLFNISEILNPWIFVYIFFVQWAPLRHPD